MNAPLQAPQGDEIQLLADEFKEELVSIMQHAIATMDTPVPWCPEADDFQAHCYIAKIAACEFMSDILDPLVGLPSYLMVRNQIVTENLGASSNCLTVLTDDKTSKDAKRKAAEALRVQIDKIYFSLNNSGGKILSLHNNLMKYSDDLAQTALKLRDIADKAQRTPQPNVNMRKLDALETQKQHLAAQLRAASWRLVDAAAESGGTFKLVNVEIADDVDWARLPMIAVAAMADDRTIALDSVMMLEGQAKICRLYADLSDAEKNIMLAQATAATFAGLAMHARDILAQRMQIGELLDRVSNHIELTLGQCTLVQSALRDGDYKVAGATLKQLATDWKEAIRLVKAFAVDISYTGNDLLVVGMSADDVRAHLTGGTLAPAEDVRAIA